jgi:hypothetical protein
MEDKTGKHVGLQILAWLDLWCMVFFNMEAKDRKPISSFLERKRSHSLSCLLGLLVMLWPVYRTANLHQVFSVQVPVHMEE